MITFL